VRAQVIGGVLAVLPLPLHHIVACGVVLKRYKRCGCEPNAIAFGAL
jgi:hypothetical protein